MIKLKLRELVDAAPALNKLDELSQSGKLVFKTTLKLAKIIKKIQPDLHEYDVEREKLYKKFGTLTKVKDENGIEKDFYDVENKEEFMKYLNQLLDIELELSNVFPFTEEDFTTVNDISVEDTIRLGKFIEDEKLEEDKKRKPIKLEIE